MSEDHYLTAKDAAEVLRMTDRQVHRYGVSGRLRTRKAGRRILYLAADVASLADELHVDARPQPQRSDIGQALDLVRRERQEVLDLFHQQRSVVDEIRAGQQETQETVRQLIDRLARPAPTPRYVFVALVLLGIIAAGLLLVAVALLIG